jgi:hypothetical protein
VSILPPKLSDLQMNPKRQNGHFLENGRNDDLLGGLVVRVPGHSSRGPGFHSRRYQIFWEVVGLERDPLSLVIITEELLEWKNSGSGSRKPRLTTVGIRCAHHATLYPQKLALTSPTSGGRWVSIVRLRTKNTDFSVFLVYGSNDFH